MRRKHLAFVAAATASGMVLAACGGDDGGGDGEEAGGEPTGAPALEGTGPFTVVHGKDTTGGVVQEILDQWNAEHPDEEATLIELPESADQQRAQMIQNAETQSDAYDVISVDNVWTAEFAANRYIVELPEEEFPVDEMLEPVIDSARYLDKLYAIPSASDGGMLYYRTDLLEAAGIADRPATWQELIDQCEQIQATPEGEGVDCYAGQFEKYEGLTVNASEAINSAGGVVTDDERQAERQHAGGRRGPELPGERLQGGLHPRRGHHLQGGGRAPRLPGGQAHLPPAVALPVQPGQRHRRLVPGCRQVRGRAAAGPRRPRCLQPGRPRDGNLDVREEQGERAGVHQVLHERGAEPEELRSWRSQAPIYTSIYDDAALQEKYPYLPVLKESILNAVPRPKVVRYGDATLAIQDAAYAALSGDMTTEEALEQLQTKLEELTQ